MQVARLEVEGLFGHFDHAIDFERSARVTLIAGPNGYGKTHLLKITKSLLTMEISALLAMPFGSARLLLSDGWALLCTQFEVEDTKGIALSAEYRGVERHAPVRIKESDLEGDEGNSPSWLIHTEDDRWFDERSGRYLNPREVERRYGIKVGDSFVRELLASNPWLTRFVSQPAPILIDTKRLDTLPTPSTAADAHTRALMARDSAAGRIGQYMLQVRAQIDEARRGSLFKQQQLDENLAQNILAASRATVNPKTLASTYQRLLALNAELSENGLAAKSVGVKLPDSTNPTERRILNVVLENWGERLEPLRPVHEKITVLRRIVNEKFLGKDIAFDESGAMRIDAEGQALRLSQLSSGEQHLLALFSLLLFSAQPGALVLIDEPEISLHAAWQHAFVKDIEDVAELSDLHLVMATHSTAIINGRWEIVRELGVV